ncbi:hypothetical protein Metme_2664 [Methylomonas methanica MC09]|uniref:Uncharacterized protein n=1 Tax=Methylomonas methanica (strain DSM 25384 / MC09) TaxID=857087 RepID=F9ZYE5_METMM|nr:hypothetical protein Metme_2664 [Methylomonas methanica MC09]
MPRRGPAFNRPSRQRIIYSAWAQKPCPPYQTARLCSAFPVRPWGLSRYAAPSTEGFERICPLGAMQGCIAFFAGAGSPFEKPRSKPSARRINAASGCLFFGILFFGQAKKSIAVAGPRTGVKSSFAIAKHCCTNIDSAWAQKACPPYRTTITLQGKLLQSDPFLERLDKIEHHSLSLTPNL